MKLTNFDILANEEEENADISELQKSLREVDGFSKLSQEKIKKMELQKEKQDLYKAVTHFDTPKVQFLLEKTPELINAQIDPIGRTALHIAVNPDHLLKLTKDGYELIPNPVLPDLFELSSILTLLVQSGASFEVKDKTGKTPLDYSSKDIQEFFF